METRSIRENILRNLPISTFKVFQTCGYLYPLKDKHWGGDLDIIEAQIAGYRRPEMLDAGCGTGWHLRSIGEARLQPSGLTGLDYSTEMLSIAAKLSSEAGLSRIRFIQSTLLAIPFANDSFEVVLCMNNTLGNLTGESFSHASQIRRNVTKELSRVVRPGASLILSVYNVEKLLEERSYGSVFQMDHKLSRPESNDFVIRFFDPSSESNRSTPYYSHWFTCDEVIQLIEQAGLVVKRETLRERRIIIEAQKQ